MAVKWDGPYGIHKDERKKPEGEFIALGVDTGSRVFLAGYVYVKSPDDLLQMANEFCESIGMQSVGAAV